MAQRYSNKLANETSPYLLQHANNPVSWFPWSEKALNKAKLENKPIIISIGYSSCHWCHVMEHESFEDHEVAKIMNENFISIKVDREERPDIDQIYMNVCQMISGRGGWPLNAIALPDGRPIYAGTYFPKSTWINLLQKIITLKKDEPSKLEEQAKVITDGINNSLKFDFKENQPKISDKDFKLILKNLINKIDKTHGGFSRAPKFPLPVAFKLLLKCSITHSNQDASHAVEITLDKMAEGGIYDQIRGGFARYSTDEHWLVPHFEKMLYDNAQLVSLYSKAYSAYGKDNYRRVVYDTIDFLKDEFMNDDGGFYSALDADSDGEEGKFYTWSYNEFKSTIYKNADLFIEYFNITRNGNWESDKNIPHITTNLEEFLEKHHINGVKFEKMLQEAKNILLDKRSKRTRPGLDDKSLTSWNALMLNGLVDAYRAFSNDEFLKLAIKTDEFINQKLTDENGHLLRTYKKGKAKINGFLDDYAFYIEALINLYQATFDEKYLSRSVELTNLVIDNFSEDKNPLFNYSSNFSEQLISKNIEFTDNVIPASNSQLAINLFLIGKMTDKNNFINRSQKMLNGIIEYIKSGEEFFANWLILADYFINSPFEVVISGKDCLEKRKQIDQNYLPNVIILGNKNESEIPLLKNRFTKGKTQIFVCKDKTCKLPTESVDEALKMIKQDIEK